MTLEGGSNQPEIKTIMGVPVVTIPLSDYAELLDCKRQIAHSYANGSLQGDGQLNLFLRDPEVAVFVVARFGIMTAREILSEVQRNYGEDRTPLQTTVNRFWMRIRPHLPPHARDMAI